jgi:flagellar hook assembly protein FlgD
LNGKKTWDGKDENGKTMSSGIYFCKFGKETEMKIIKLR